MNKLLKAVYRVLLVIPFLILSGAWSSSEPGNYMEVIPGTDLSIEMIRIPGGTFLMGSPEEEAGRKADEGPRHDVKVDAFWMSSVEITWDQYEVFLYRNKDDIPHPDPGTIELDVDGVSGATMPYVNFNKPGYPVVDITQYAASVFCEWLTARTGRFYRLPTEAEWEYACRAGSEGAFSFDDASKIDDYAWYSANSNATVNRGKMKKPNAWGLYDMHGNAAEWVLDFYQQDAYARENGVENPLVSSDKLYPHVVRGGSWRDDPAELRSASREKSDPDWKKQDPQFPKSLWWHTDALHVGFRIVRPAEVPEPEEQEKFRIKPIKDY